MTEKRFNVFDVDGTVFVGDHQEGSYHIGEKENVDIHCLNDIADKLNSLAEENEQLKHDLNNSDGTIENLSEDYQKLLKENKKFKKENEELKQQIKDLKISVLDSIHEAEEIQCYCNPCVVEYCVKKVIKND